MTEKFSKWDAAEHLRTRDDAQLYLQACADEDPGDGSLIRAAVGRRKNSAQRFRAFYRPIPAMSGQ